MKVRIRRLRDGVDLPRYQTPGAAAFDLAAAEDVTVPAGAVRLIGTGLVVEVPPDCFLAIFARSSLPLRKGLMVANGVGIVDTDYRGPDDEVKVAVVNVTGDEVRVARGERLAQGLLLPASRVQWEEVATSDAPTRGGFGGTAGYATE